MLVIITGTFFMQRFVPGGPFTAEKAVTPEVLRNLEAYYHLNDPLWKQYTDYLWDLCPKKLNLRALADGLDKKVSRADEQVGAHQPGDPERGEDEALERRGLVGLGEDFPDS